MIVLKKNPKKCAKITESIVNYNETIGHNRDLFSRVLQTYVVNFICQKVQNFWADSDYLGKISNKKIFNFFFSMFSFA